MQQEPPSTVIHDRKPRVTVLMTCFNRRESTLRCLEHLFTQTALPQVDLQVVLVDDGSTDGTAEAVNAAFPQRVEVLPGTGKLFWNGGMHVAFRHAQALGFDFCLWLNDDTLLFPTALDVLLTTHGNLRGQGIEALVTGSTHDARTGMRSYGGSRWKQGWKRELEPVTPDPHHALACDTVNGNCTLISRQVADVVGNLDSHFTHSFGDFDYGFRAGRAGFGVYTAPGYLGTCSDNTRQGTWRDRSTSVRTRWRHLNSVKGSPFSEWAVYCHRHLGWLWPLYLVSPYLKALMPTLRGSAPVEREA